MNAVRQKLTEQEFQALVVDLANALGWRHNFTRRTIGKGRKWTTATSVVGWPDLVLFNPSRGGVLFRELKTDVGKLSDEQRVVLEQLRAAGADARVWRPGDLEDGTIQRELDARFRRER